MYLQKDWLMHQIETAIQIIAKLLLNKNIIIYPLTDPLEKANFTFLHENLLELLTVGKINEAEDLLHQNMAYNSSEYATLALDFYNRLNALDDDFLEDNDFSREEIKLGLTDLFARLGVDVSPLIII